ncbi:hypothetical protein AN958_12165 [Leucoagaricus sp. SymC.cos]|nr:hypothetical protein AN958_12165 [Leucoagaricus sp. SymC.cos]
MFFNKSVKFSALLTLVSLLDVVSAQRYRRLGVCQNLGCIFPPDQTDFYPRQLFDVCLGVHTPESGREASNSGVPDEAFSLCIKRGKGSCVDATKFFRARCEPAQGKQSFTRFYYVPTRPITCSSYFEDLFAQDAHQSTKVNVASRIYRAVFSLVRAFTHDFTQPEEYTAVLTRNSKNQTVANWVIREASTHRKAKNAILFIGDMACMRKKLPFFSLGTTQTMTTAAHLIGHKSINGRYQSLMQLDQMELRASESDIGLIVVSNPMTHSIDLFITGLTNSASALHGGVSALNAWVVLSSPEALELIAAQSPNSFGDPKFETIAEFFRRRRQGGVPGIVSAAFIAGATPGGEAATTIYKDLNSAEAVNKTFIWPTSSASFRCNVYVVPDNLKGQQNSPTGDGSDALNQPGLKDMTLEAIDILHIDKMTHALDYDRALGELLELDDTIRATVEHLEKIGELDDTLIVVTADHGHGFYQVSPGAFPDNTTIVYGPFGPNFPVQWNLRYTFAGGVGGNRDHRENYKINLSGPRNPTALGDVVIIADLDDSTDGLYVSGTSGPTEAESVHSLTDNGIDIFFKMADALGLGAVGNGGLDGHGHGH